MADQLRGAADAASASTDYHSLLFVVEQALAQISTATVVKVTKAPYDANGKALTPGSASAIGYIDVQPLVNQLDGNGKPTPHETVYHLSYHRYQGGNGAFITDPAVGDIGKMVVADRDTSQVKSTDAQANPGSRRKFDKADGTFFGQTQAKAPSQYFSWTADGFLIVDKHGNKVVSDSTGVMINGCLINKNGDVITKAGHDLDHHLHSGVTTGSSNTGQPV